MTKVWQENKEIWDSVAASNGFHRAAAPEEIAGTVLYLASDLASFTTGTVVVADAGQTAH
jgi:enoyl-[acyl-carrier-protein] reductase (NADH)